MSIKNYEAKINIKRIWNSGIWNCQTTRIDMTYLKKSALRQFRDKQIWAQVQERNVHKRDSLKIKSNCELLKSTAMRVPFSHNPITLKLVALSRSVTRRLASETNLPEASFHQNSTACLLLAIIDTLCHHCVSITEQRFPHKFTCDENETSKSL